jgi:ATP/maltotriose-dependent transcriptional regulator MalT
MNMPAKMTREMLDRRSPVSPAADGARGVLIARPAIARASTAVNASRAATLIAPAGYGKTAAMHQWADMLADDGRNTIFIRATPAPDALNVLLELAGDRKGQAATNAEGLACRVLTEMKRRELHRPAILIDDAHRLAPDACALLSALSRQENTAVTIILSGRRAPAIPLARLRVQGLLAEAGVEDLRFERLEAMQLLAAHGRPIDALNTHCDLLDGADGWAAGLLLASRGGPESRLVREAGDYIFEEVLAGQPDKLRTFLQHVAVLQKLSAESCKELTRARDAGKLLRQAFDEGLLLRRDGEDEGVYEFLPLMADILRRRLKQQDAAAFQDLCRRAASQSGGRGNFKHAAQMAAQSEESPAAYKALRNAAMIAAEAGWSRLILDEGPARGRSLAEGHGGEASCGDRTEGFVRRLLEQTGACGLSAPADECVAPGRLAARELEIIAMVGEGLRNREIGNRLGLTENTVKWHVQQIYTKLGVHRRVHAVDRARQLGMIA